MTSRREYDGDGLPSEQVPEVPFPLIEAWVGQARARQDERGDVPEPDALQVATVDADGAPDVRTVLMRFLDARGPGFVTCLTSTKGQHLLAHPAVAAALVWPSMFRAIRWRGVAQQVDAAEVEAYFQQRPWGSRISAWASRQSEPVASREELQRAFDEYAERFPDTGRPDDVPVPEHWGALRVRATRVEFWAGRVNRLHDRWVFQRQAPSDLDDPGWSVGRVQP